MKFDKSRVYTALNADELKIGSKVIVASNITELKERVADYCDNGNYDKYIVIIDKIETEQCTDRFVIRKDTGYYVGNCFSLAYLVSKPNALRCEDLKIGDIISNGNLDYMVLGINRSSGITSDVFLPCIGWRNDEDLVSFIKKEKD